jgi:hypothetical protein
VRVEDVPSPSPYPSLRFVADKSGEAVAWVFPLTSFWIEGINGILERHWSFEAQEESLSILGCQNVRSIADMKRLIEGAEVFRTFDSIGRRRGTTSIAPDEFRSRLPRVYAEFCRDRGRRPTNQDLADALYVSVATLKRYKSRHLATGGNWPPEPVD